MQIPVLDMHSFLKCSVFPGISIGILLDWKRRRIGKFQLSVSLTYDRFDPMVAFPFDDSNFGIIKSTPSVSVSTLGKVSF